MANSLFVAILVLGTESLSAPVPHSWLDEWGSPVKGVCEGCTFEFKDGHVALNIPQTMRRPAGDDRLSDAPRLEHKVPGNFTATVVVHDGGLDGKIASNPTEASSTSCGLSLACNGRAIATLTLDSEMWGGKKLVRTVSLRHVNKTGALIVFRKHVKTHDTDFKLQVTCANGVMTANARYGDIETAFDKIALPATDQAYIGITGTHNLGEKYAFDLSNFKILKPK